MNLNEMSKEELELLSYTDLTYKLLKETKKTMNTANLFQEICNLLEYSESEFADKIGDYYTSLTLDKRFVLLETNEWDIRDNHSIDLSMDEIDEEEVDEEIEEEEEEIEEELEESEDLYDDDAEILDDDGDDLDDLAILDEEELEEE